MGRVKTEDHFVGVMTKFNVGDIVYRIYHKSDSSTPQIKRLRVQAIHISLNVDGHQTTFGVGYDLSKPSITGELTERNVHESRLYTSTEELVQDILQTEE